VSSEAWRREAVASLAARLFKARAQVETMAAFVSAVPCARHGGSGGTPAAGETAPLSEIADVTEWLEGVPLQISSGFGNWGRRPRRRALRSIRALLPKKDTISSGLVSGARPAKSALIRAPPSVLPAPG
jgi:hypothetical protein